MEIFSISFKLFQQRLLYTLYGLVTKFTAFSRGTTQYLCDYHSPTYSPTLLNYWSSHVGSSVLLPQSLLGFGFVRPALFICPSFSFLWTTCYCENITDFLSPLSLGSVNPTVWGTDKHLSWFVNCPNSQMCLQC